MKFLPIALAALVGFTDAKKAISGKELKTRMKKGQFNKRSLMRGAKPYGDTARKLEEQEWEINGEYSIQFNSCLSLTIADEDLLDEGIIYYAAQGQVVAQKSYILFDVCYSEDCYYQADDSKMTFVTDIGTFFEAFADFLPNQVEQYCEGCQENEGYCDGSLEAEMAEQEAEEEAADEEEEEAEEGSEEDGEEGEEDGEDGEGEDEGDRKLSKIVSKKNSRRKLKNNEVVEQINCNTCELYECFDAEEEDNNERRVEEVEYEFEDALEWLNGLSECQQVEDYQWNDIDLYAGLICNAEGTGVEIGVFLDEDCSMYTNQKSFSSVMSYADKEYFQMSSEVVEYMFTSDFSCYQPEVTYINPYTEQEEEEEQDENEEYEAPEAAEWCQDLFGGDFDATNLYDCGAEENEDEEEQEEAEEDENLSYYDWYSYQLDADDAEDAQATCEVIKALEGEYTTVYDKENSGVLYDYSARSSSSKDGVGGMSGGAIAFILLVVVGAAAGAAYVFKGKSANDKKTPLINNGSMA